MTTKAKSSSRKSRSDRFLEVLSKYARVVFVTHDNPDPDAIAAGWALMRLVQEKLCKPARLVGGGAIVRAENRHMVKLLGAPIQLVRHVRYQKNMAVVLVDCAVGTQNHLFPDGKVVPVAVIDHHGIVTEPCQVPFRDIRPNMAASVSIAASYLREQRIVPDEKLATAILYAIRTETRGSETHYTRLDRSVLRWATEKANPSWLAEIEDAPLPTAYFADLVLALQSTTVYGVTAVCLLPRANGPEIVGEVADLLIRCDTIHRVLCGAVIHQDLIVSVRTEIEEEDASALVRTTLKGIGQGGGHRRRAGGKIPGAARRPSTAEAFRDEIKSRWLAACGADPRHGHRLVARYEIVQNLYGRGGPE